MGTKKLTADQEGIIAKIDNGDKLRNYACFLFLEKIRNTINLQDLVLESSPEFKKLTPVLQKITEKCEKYDENNFPYGDLYSSFLTHLENTIRKIDAIKDEESKKGKLESLCPLVKTIYLNESLILEVAANRVKAATRKVKMDSLNLFKQTEKVINTYLDKGKSINQITPQGANSRFRRFLSVFGRNVRPLALTSMPSITNYGYKENLTKKKITELRLGTQAEIDNEGNKIVSSTFKLLLKMIAEEKLSAAQENTTSYTYVYFNALGYDRFDAFEGPREKGMSEALHKLEDVTTGVAVITLPSDKGEMDHHLLSKHMPSITVKDAKAHMLKIASGETTDALKIRDFNISLKVKQTLYKGMDEKKKLADLIKTSFAKLGFESDEAFISPAQQQAIYFHFIKFELTDFILDRLEPDTINFSCKDGIDRGGIASAYYNLIKSIESGHPMEEYEFKYKALHAAPALVKGRGMNNNIERLWNAIDAYIEGKKSVDIKKDVPWLVEWRNNYAPSFSRLGLIKRLDHYINMRTKEHEETLNYEKHFSSPNKALETSQFNSILGKYTASEKIKVATKLKKALEILKKGQSIDDNYFTPQEKKLLNDGRLRDIFNDVKNNGFIDQTHNDVEGEAEGLRPK